MHKADFKINNLEKRKWLQTVVNAVSSESDKRQEQNVSVDTVKARSAAVTLFGAFVE